MLYDCWVGLVVNLGGFVAVFLLGLGLILVGIWF